MWGYFINIFSFYARRHVWGISLKPLFCSNIIHKRIFEESASWKKVDNVGGAKKTHGRWINHISLNLIRITDTDKVTSGGERSVELPLWQYHDEDDDELWQYAVDDDDDDDDKLWQYDVGGDNEFGQYHDEDDDEFDDK